MRLTFQATLAPKSYEQVCMVQWDSAWKGNFPTKTILVGFHNIQWLPAANNFPLLMTGMRASSELVRRRSPQVVRHHIKLCPLSPFFFNFVIDTVMKDSLPASNTCGVEVLPGSPLTDIEYADDTALLGSDPVVMQTILNNLNNSASRFGMRFTPAKCKVLLQDWVDWNPSLMLADEPIETLYANSRGRVKVYGKLSSEFTISSDVRQGCRLSPFLFNFVIDTIMEDALPAFNACGVEVIPGPTLTDIEYANDIALLGSDPVVMQTILNNLNNSASRFGMRFTPAKCKVLLQDWVGSNPSLVLADEPMEVVGKFVCLGSCISPSALAKDDISIRIGRPEAFNA
ncbi:hypothetical protein T265_01308 [Opisthorchis viverrini]|uniref:Reverse transcriptase domain-containing protein n=1 Tax=Opisthorchis viverrini TaxID=6198 RepID=A0A075AA33_OPIVI|nr:hypothetical protein T265_01308 [Opisthorchis viverrini]KER32620.1 hypothetical protein T265_01308 [Opisthorchis viverrini]